MRRSVIHPSALWLSLVTELVHPGTSLPTYLNFFLSIAKPSQVMGTTNETKQGIQGWLKVSRVKGQGNLVGAGESGATV